MIDFVHFTLVWLMPSPLRLRERLRSFFWPNLDDIQTMAEEDLQVMETELQPLEIPEVGEVATPTIPTVLYSKQFPQKELVSGMEQLLPEILEESKNQGEVVQIFLAICCLDTLKKTDAKFFFCEKDLEEAKGVIIQWAQCYQNINYVLPSVMATVHWGFTPIVW